jgi:hypothetical protein
MRVNVESTTLPLPHTAASAWCLLTAGTGQCTSGGTMDQYPFIARTAWN